MMRLAGVAAGYAEFITRKLSTKVAPFTVDASYDDNFLQHSAGLTFHLNTNVKGPHGDTV